MTDISDYPICDTTLFVRPEWLRYFKLSFPEVQDIAHGGTGSTTASDARDALGVQAFNVYLQALSGLSTDGMICKSGVNALTRTLTAGSTRLSITNGSGVSGNPTLDVVEANVNVANLGGQSQTANIANNAVTYAKIQQVAAGKILANSTGSTANVAENSATNFGFAAINLTASAGGIPYSLASSAGMLSGTATAGKVLQSGSSAAPTWSTPTYPSASGTAAKILISDGTNNIYSTPTWPTSASTLNTRVKSDGTNLVMSTTTIADSGTLNKVLIGDGTNYVESTPSFPNASATTLKYIRSDGTNWIASTSTLPDSYTQGDILYASASNVISALAKNTSSTRYLSNTGTSNNPAWSQVDVTNGITGSVPLGNGGCGGTTAVTNRAGLIVTGMLKAVQTYTSSTTWTKPSNLDFVIVEVVGGGGGGGGTPASGATGAAAAAGGGGGGYSRMKIAAASLGATETVTVGAAGSAGAAGANAGGTGGTSSFGAWCSATGGTGGTAGSATAAANTMVSVAARVNGGIGSGGDINLCGGPGERGLASGVMDNGMGGAGGSSFYCGGRGSTNAISTTTAGNPPDAGYGGGGSGACDSNNSTAAGGAGLAGIVIVNEYYL